MASGKWRVASLFYSLLATRHLPLAIYLTLIIFHFTIPFYFFKSGSYNFAIVYKIKVKILQVIAIETYKKEQHEEIIKLILEIQQVEFNIPINLDDQPDLKDIPGFYQKGKGNFWMALNNGSVVGTIGLIDIGKNKTALRKMFVHKDFRGNHYGIGSQLLLTLLSWIKEKKINTIYLGTRAEMHAAHRFYEKNGFDEIPQSTLPENFPRMPLDNKFYKYENQA